MARSSGGGGSRFASSNLNDLYGKQALSGVNIGSGGSKSRYLHGSSTSHGGMLVLARPVRTPPNKQVKPAQPKLTVPAPVNLPSLRKEHAGNDPNITLVGGTGVSGWSKQQVSIHQQQSGSFSVEDPSLGDAHIKSNGWGVSQSQQLTQGGMASTDSPGASGKYTPPAARGSMGSTPAAPIRSSSAVVLRGEDFPTLQAAAPFNPVTSQQRQRELQQRQKEKQREMKQQAKLQQLSQNQFEKENDEDDSKPSSPVLALQPQSKQGGPRDDSVRNYFSLKENRKPNDLSLRPGPLIHLNHTSNWADDERETASMSKPSEWEDPPRYHGQAPFGRPSFQRDDRGTYRREMSHSGDYGRSREMQDFGWDREGHSGRGDWTFGRNGGFDRMEMEESRGDSRGSSWRLRDSYHHNRDSFARESLFNKSGGGDRGRFGARNGGFDLPVRVRSPYTEDTFMRDFPELPNLDFRLDLKYRVRRKREDVTDGSYRDLERESFETELERVQKEQEQERQKKIEERERSLELARKEEEERERLAREEEERQRRLEEEAREAAVRAEQEALDSVRKVEEAKKAREEEKRRMVEEEERRKENARRKLLELEERIARRQMDKKQSKNGPEEPGIPAAKGNTVEDNDERPNSRFPSHRVQQDQTRLRSPDIHSIGRDTMPRVGDDRPRFSSSSWRRDFSELSPFDQGNNVMHSPGRKIPDEAENFYGNTDASSDNFRRDREEKWSSNGDHMRNVHFSRSNSFMDQAFGEEDRRWGRRPRESRPFSPPSPSSYGSSTYEVSDGLSYGRLRQSLPKQPRVLPPPTRTQAQRPSSSVFSGPTTVTSHLDIQEESTANASDVNDGENISTEQKFSEEEACGTEVVDVPDEVVVGDIQTSVQDDQAESSSPEDMNCETLDEVVEEIQMSEHNKSSKETDVTSEQSEFKPTPEVHDVRHLDADSSLSELVDSIVVIPKTEVVEGTELEDVSVVVDEEKTETKDDAPEAPADVPARPLLPSPLRTTQPPLQQPFHHPPNFVPTQLSLLDPRPRMQGPLPERPMTLQFGLLPGTTLLQGSVPAIQIGSIQMPLQLHPPIGHHVAHLQPPPQFQFGQIGQQAPLLPSFTVHPQAMLQPSMINVDGQQGVPGQQFRMQPHAERTFWTQQFGQGSQGLQLPIQEKNLTQARVFDGDQDDSRQRQGSENPEAVIEDSWKTSYSDGQTGFNRLQEKTDTKQSHARQENHSESFRKRPNRRANSDLRSSNLPERGHYVPRKGGKADELSETEKSRQAVDLACSDRILEVSGGSDEDDFIEVRSKRQVQKEKQVKAKPKHSKVKEQTPKQRNSSKSLPPRDIKSESTSLQNCLDAVVTTRQIPLANPEVGFEKRTRSPQPAQNNSLVSDAPAFPAIVPEGPQANGSSAWGFSRANQEVVALTQIQLEEAMKPVRFEVPLPPQVPLSEHLSSALESTPSVTAKEKGPRPAAASGPVNSLLAGEKIQFGAVTMPAFSSTVSWLGPSRSEGFLGGRKELQESELASFEKGKRSRENEDGTIDSEAEAEAAEAEAAASAVAVAAISNDDYLHNADQLVSSHGVIGSSSSNKSSPAGLATSNATQPSGIDEAISVSLPADLSVDMPLRGPLHSGPHLPPGSFPGLEMGALLGGPVFAFSSGGDNSRDSNVERAGGLNWQPRHGVDSFYGPHGFAGPFINHGPIPSIPPHTLVYTSPFGGVGQFGQLGVSYMGPTHMPPVKQPDWKHTPVSSPAGVGSTNSAEIGSLGAGNGSGSGSGSVGSGGGGGGGGGMLYAHHNNNRPLAHDPSVISVVPPGPFDLYRDMAFQSHWSHVPGPHLANGPMSGPIPAFPPMHLRHPHPTYHMQQTASDASNMTAATSAVAPAEASDQYLDELGLGDAMSTGSADSNNSFSVQQQQQHQHQQQQLQQMPTKPPSPVSSLPAGSKLRSRVVHTVEGSGSSSRPNSGNSRLNTSPAPTMPNFQAHSYVATASASLRRSIGHQEKRMDRTVAQQQQQQQHGNHGGSKMGGATIPGSSGWSNQQNRKGGQGRSFASENASAKNSGGSSASAGSSAMAAAKLKQVYVVKPPAAASSSSDHSLAGASEIFSADARHM